jgi:diguanylate cyclase (GGDEF)-like protein
MLNWQAHARELSDSAYAEELCRAQAGPFVSTAVEAEFQLAHLQRMKRRVRIWVTVATSVSVVFTIGHFEREGVRSPLFLAHALLLLPCSIALVWLAWGRRFYTHFLRVAPTLNGLFVVCVGSFVSLDISKGQVEEITALTCNLFALFFFSGLHNRNAAVAALASGASFGITALVVHMPSSSLVKYLIWLVITAATAAIVQLDIERTNRSKFLEESLLAQIATRDALSSLMNRRAFDEHLNRVWTQGLNDQRLISVLMIDIDHFKQFNDAFGHQMGDAELRSVARAVKEFSLRPLDLAARYGGEEFAVILYDLESELVRQFGERLRSRVKNRATVDPSGSAGTSTVSVGIASVVPALGRTPQGLVQLADEALYEAKRAGRDCCVVKSAVEYAALRTGTFQRTRMPNDRRRSI